MKIAIMIDRNAALSAGHDRHGWVILDMPAAELSVTERETLIRIDGRVASQPGADYVLGRPGVADYTLAQAEGIADFRSAITQILAAEADAAEAERAESGKRAAKRAAETAEAAEAAQAWLVAEPEGWSPPAILNPECNYCRLNLLPAELAEQVRARHARREQICAERNAAAEAEKLAAEAHKQAQLAAVIAQLGNDNQRARHAEGLLPAREGWELLEQEQLTRLGDLEHYERGADLTSDPACPDEYCESCSRQAEPISRLNADEYERLTEIRRRLPEGAKAELRREKASCGCGGAHNARTYVRATWRVGEYEICRDLPLSDEVEL